AGKFSVDTATCQFPPIVNDVFASLETLIGSRTLLSEVPVELPAVVADEKRVAQVLTNLLANAIKFTPADGAITVRTKIADGFLLTEVADTGVGISAEDIPKIFRVFVQVDMTN